MGICLRLGLLVFAACASLPAVEVPAAASEPRHHWKLAPSLPGHASAATPAPAVFRDRLRLAYRGRRGDPGIHVASSEDGVTWDRARAVRGHASDRAPALAVFRDRLHLAYRGRDGNIRVTSSEDGVAWSEARALPGSRSRAGPSLAVFRDRLYLARRGRPGDPRLFVASSVDGAAWSDARVVPGHRSNHAPALAVFLGRLHLAHRSHRGANVFVTSTADGVAWSNARLVREHAADRAPALAVYRDRLYLAHRGRRDDAGLYLASTADGEEWTRARRLARSGSEAAPALAVFEDQLVLAHRGGWRDPGLFVTSTNAHPIVDADAIPFRGEDRRRIAANLLELPESCTGSFDLATRDWPAEFTKILFDKAKVAHVQFFLRLNVRDAGGAAYFLITHSQDGGGSVAVARVDPERVAGHEIRGPGFAGEVIWWEKLDGSHPSGGCNHPGDAGQVGSVVAIAGQDWRDKLPLGLGHVVDPVGNGDAVLFYDFSLLASGAGSPYLGCLRSGELGLKGDRIEGAGVEQGPDGMVYLYAAGPGETVVWKSDRPHPDAEWTRVHFYADGSINSGTGDWKWSRMGGADAALWYCNSGTNAMTYTRIRYEWDGEAVVGLCLSPAGRERTTHDERFGGSDDWAADNGSIYVSPTGAVTLFGAYKSANETKTTRDGREVEAIQVRFWATGR